MGFPGGSSGKEPCCQCRGHKEAQIPSLGWEDPLEEGMAIHSSILAWRIPLTEEPGRLQSTGSHRVGVDWRVLALMHPGRKIDKQRDDKCINKYISKQTKRHIDRKTFLILLFSLLHNILLNVYGKSLYFFFHFTVSTWLYLPKHWLFHWKTHPPFWVPLFCMGYWQARANRNRELT